MSGNVRDRRSPVEDSTSGRKSFPAGLALIIFGFVLFTAVPFAGIIVLFWGILIFFLQASSAKQARDSNIPQAKSTSRPAQRFDLEAPDHDHIKAPPLPKINSQFPTTSSFSSNSPDHNHITAVSGHTKKRELEQLETMLSAGLIEKDEYQMRKAKINARYS